MDEPSHAAIHAVLEPNEHLLWSGHPIPIRGNNILVWVAATFLVAFAAWPVVVAVRDGFHPVQLVFTVAGGLGLAVLLLQPRVAARRTYAVTDRRLLILHRAFWNGTKAYAIRAVSPANVQVVTHGAGVGTVRFMDFAQRCAYDKNELCMPTFDAIADVERVAELIRTASGAARGMDVRFHGAVPLSDHNAPGTSRR